MVNIESLLQYAQPEKIDLGEYEEDRLGFILPNGLICVNGKAPLEEQVKTVLHEIIHLAPEFRTYNEGCWNKTITRKERVEEKIESHAQEIYRTRPDVVKVIEERLAAAALDPRNKPEKVEEVKYRRN